MGSAFNATCRQIGAALGIAVAVAVLGRPGTRDFVESFDVAWTFVAVTALAAGGLVFLAYRRPPDAPEPDVELLPAVVAD
jgi:hypothetical protein